MSTSLAHAAPILRSAELRAVEQDALRGRSPAPLMARAGLAAAERARELAGDQGKPILVLAGPGNNGGDAFVVALHLKQWWYRVCVVCPADPRRYAGEAAAALAAWRAAGGELLTALPDHSDWALIIDGLFGIGLQRDLGDPYAPLVHRINSLGVPILALDVPSGLDADRGVVRGCAVQATHTITFMALKPGLLTGHGPDHCGALQVADLGLADAVAQAHGGRTVGPAVLKAVLPLRARNTHKGNFGSVGIIGGAHGMAGAALLAARAALKLGAGRVYCGLLADDIPLLDPLQPELMLRPADGVLRLEHLNAIAIGPGLGNSPDAAEYLDWALEAPVALVLDADALNLIALTPELKDKLKQRVAHTLLTPHPAEAARLLGCSTSDVQQDRVAAAMRLAQDCRAGVVLKGAGSICAWPDAAWTLNLSGNPGMASAGMGDVLTGLIAALLAQDVEPHRALAAAVYLHGAAADQRVAAGCGPIGLTAGEVIDAARSLINAR